MIVATKCSPFSLLIFCVLLSNLTPSCSGQADGSSQPSSQPRCVSPNNSDDDFGMLCETYYSGSDGYINGSETSGLLETLQKIIDTLQNEPDNICVELMENYLCHYYFPSCNMTTGEIIPVCSSSCGLLTNNEDCSELMKIINMQLKQDNVTSPFDCLQTHHMLINPPKVSENCLSIEDTLNESVPLTCIEIKSDETCLPQLENSYYAPATFSSTSTVFSEFQKIIPQLDPLDVCRAFISTVICVFRFPACNPTTGRILPICPNICDLVDTVVELCTVSQFYRHNPEFPAVNQLLDTFICLEPTSYYNFPAQYIETDPNDCSGFLQGLPVVSSTPESEDDDFNNLSVIIGAVIGVCVVVILLVILVVAAVLCVKQKKIKKKKFLTRQDSQNEYSEQPSKMRYDAHYYKDGRLGLNVSCAEPSPYLTPVKEGTNEEDTMKAAVSLSSLQLLEVSNFLDYVKAKFSEVLLPVDTITKQELLGKGAFGVVHKGEMISSDGNVTSVAIKTIKSSSLGAMKDLVAESTIMKTFHHPNVLPLLGVCIDYDDEDVLKVVMPFMSNGDLRNFLKNNRVSPNNIKEYPKDLSEKIFLRMCFDIAKGMEYLATKKFIHRDLAARNCMVDNLLTIKIADFGLAKDIYSTEYYRVYKHTTLPVKWMSLESLLDGYFDEKTDVWSYGVTCWEIFSLGRIPYPGVDNANVITVLKSGKRLVQPQLCPSKLNDLIMTTWLEEPDDRPTFAMIVKDLCSICDFTEAAVADEESVIKDNNEDTAESNECSICDFTEAAVADEESIIKDTDEDTAESNEYIN